MSDTLLACLESLAGPDIAVAVEPVGALDGLLEPEPEAIQKAIPQRQAEFAAGRRAARTALIKAQLPTGPIPQGERRAPDWPSGVIGSISHDAGLAIASVARPERYAGLGIDLAEATDFPPHLRKEILHTPDEHAQNGIEARLSFSAKEAVFKSFFPSVRRYFGFDAVEIVPDISGGKFTVKLRRPLGTVAEGETFTGRCAICEGRLVTLLAIPS